MDYFTLSGDEAGWLRNKSGATKLGFAVQLKFLTWRGRFPKTRLELPPDAVEHVAKQAGVAASELGFYDFTDRTAQRHRTELRKLTGWHECSKTDTLKLVSHLVDANWHDERRDEQIRAELFRQMRHDLIEPPTPDQVTAIIRSALHQADERAVAEVAARLAREEDCPPPAGRAGLHRPDRRRHRTRRYCGRGRRQRRRGRRRHRVGTGRHQGPSGQRQPQLATG
ncbi:DUF4158 domain-containing protein [Streptomyces chlorus]|uniref:DUF4158 domain-containing protein n=1 Tax=Streptomyces chlorus TaxID=887452 RepID=A0ABW1DVV3_9ACTN